MVKHEVTSPVHKGASMFKKVVNNEVILPVHKGASMLNKMVKNEVTSLSKVKTLKSKKVQRLDAGTNS